VSPRGIELRSLAKTFFPSWLNLAGVDESPCGVAPPALAVVKPTKRSSSEATIESPRGVATEALSAVEPKKQSDSDRTLKSSRGVAAGLFDAVRSENQSA
jgi:hypothetical protein